MGSASERSCPVRLPSVRRCCDAAVFRSALALCVCATIAFAQVEEAKERPPPGDLRADATNADVYVNDSFEVADTITRARVLARRGEWADAASQLQRASDAAAGKLVRVAPGEYVGVRKRVSQIIAQWPAEGLAAFRSLYERDMEEALRSLDAVRRSQPGDERLGLALFDRYFCTAAAAELADAIGQRAIESGDLDLAAHVYRRVLDEHSDRDQYRARYGAMLALVHAMRGDAAPEVDPELLGVRVRWKGEDRPLATVLDAVREQFAALRVQPASTYWPVFGGNEERSRTTDTNVDEPGLLWRFDFEDTDSRSSREGAGSSTSRNRDRGGQLTMQPVVGDDLLYVQRGREIVALHRHTGVAAWRFQGSQSSSTSLTFLDEKAPGWDSITLHGGRVYASLPGDPVPYYSYESAGNPAELVCFDAATGGEIWRLEQQAIEEQFAEISFDSSPLIHGDQLLVTGRRRRSFGFEDAYLYCFNTNTGELRYRTHLGSASTGTFGSRAVTRSVATMRGDRVFVCSNLGTVAAASVHTGEVQWLSVYERNRMGNSEGSSTQSVRPWHLNPILCVDDRLVLFPRDASNVLVLSAENGKALQTVPVSTIAGIRTVLGLKDATLCGAGEVAACYDLKLGALIWSRPIPDGVRPYGRGVWAGDRLLVPTQTQLSAFRVADGERTDAAWDAEGEGGNLLALPKEIVVAGVDRVSVFVRKKEIWQTLRDRMAAAPTDPTPALELAEVALNSGETSQAIQMLDEAMRRADAREAPLDTSLRRRVFDDVLLFVERLAQRSVLDAELLEKLFAYASQHAPDAAAHLQYRFVFAQMFERYDRLTQAVRLHHQILRDHSLRGLPVDPSVVGSDMAGEQARSQIASLIERHGRSIYKPYEAQAGQWLERAQATGDETLFEQIVSTFPNSDVAPRALVAHGDLLAGRGHANGAAERFSQALHRYSRTVDRPALLRRIADAYEAAGKRAHAYRWLTKAAREHPAVRWDDRGRSIGFLDYRDRLADVRDQVEPSRPRITLPLNGRASQTFGASARLLVPRFGSAPSSSWSRYFVYTSSGIVAYDSASGGELWAKPAAAVREPVLLQARTDVAFFATQHEVFTVDLATGQRRWSAGEPLDEVEGVIADWEDNDTFRNHALQGRRLLSVRDHGEMTCRNIDTGQLIWSQTHRPAPAGRVVLGERWVAYHIVQDESPVVCLLDAATGSWAGAVITKETRAIEDLFVTLDSRIVVATSESIASYDPQSRKRRWRVTLSGHLHRPSLRLDVDALCFSDDGHRIKKLGLEDGVKIWESERMIPRGDDDLAVTLQGGSVMVSSETSVSAIDRVTGLTLWRATTPDHPRFLSRLLTDSHLAAVDIPREPGDASGTAYFYDHRGASGVIAREGGAPDLGILEDVRAVMAVDGALLIQTGPTVRVWRHR